MCNRVKTLAAAIVLTVAMFSAAAAAQLVRTPSCPAYACLRHEVLPSRQPCSSLDDCDRKAFDQSGTRGRMGLGADPAHPEGPGNFSD
jgi:hypothetical protein